MSEDPFFSKAGAEMLDMVPTQGFDVVREHEHPHEHVHEDTHKDLRKARRPKTFLHKHDHAHKHHDDDVEFREEDFDVTRQHEHPHEHVHEDTHNDLRKAQRPKNFLHKHGHRHKHHDDEDVNFQEENFDVVEEHEHDHEHVHENTHRDLRAPQRPKNFLHKHDHKHSHYDVQDYLAGRVTGLAIQPAPCTAIAAGSIQMGPALIDGNPATAITHTHKEIHIHENMPAYYSPTLLANQGTCAMPSNRAITYPVDSYRS